MRKNQKGFLIALCLCMLSVSGIFGVYQYRKGLAVPEPEKEVPRQSAQVQEQEEPEKEAANSSGTVAQADTEEEEAEQAKIDTEEDIYKIGEAELAQTEEIPQEPMIAEETPAEEPPAEEVPQEEEESVETSGQSDRLSFSDQSKILWPVNGDVILNYSMDKSIYFSTLNQYKYHPAIVISAPVGSEVHCAARGKVSKIYVNEETGTTVLMQLGKGYDAVYGQLKEVAVEEGDVVEQGSLIGYVSEPTKYYTLEGSNLYFQLLKKSQPINPMDYME
ncbi:MAG: M23 family metallopeptidase [Lachnospiraceae bacterium]|nr:M23 family metallopeptidase [Lachnospiraceae bacterium]